MSRLLFIFLFAALLSRCSKHGGEPTPVIPLEIKAADLSFLPEVRASGLVIKNSSGVAEDMLQTLQTNGVNCVRLRLWKNPASATSSFNTVKALAQEIKSKGMKVWLTVHYSDTWADPGHQQKPAAWATAGFAQLKDSVSVYTKKIVQEIAPDYIQIGNEINDGFLWPEGRMSSNIAQLKELLSAATQAVRSNAPGCKIMLHCAGYTGASYFFNTLAGIDYDIMALSYYPVWHGKDMGSLQTALSTLSSTFNKPVVIAETAYPFSLGFNDYTNNIIGDNSQLIPAYPASPQGQKDFLLRLKSIMKDNSRGPGILLLGR
ncbi:MAG: glycosyl hydrolase 53 family protein [Ferruginibacter sp.]